MEEAVISRAGFTDGFFTVLSTLVLDIFGNTGNRLSFSYGLPSILFL